MPDITFEQFLRCVFLSGNADAEVHKAVKDLKNGKAVFITKDADGDAPTAYIIVKNDINGDKKEYVSGTNRSSVLQNMKSDDFKKVLKDEAKKLSKDKKFSENESYFHTRFPVDGIYLILKMCQHIAFDRSVGVFPDGMPFSDLVLVHVVTCVRSSDPWVSP